MRGFFRMDYTGKVDSGAGTLAFVDGKVAGLDTGGGIYRGQYTVDGQTVSGIVELSFPNGGRLVTGAVVQAGSPPMTIPFSVSETAAEGKIFRVDTPTGPVNVRLTRLADL